MNKFRVYDKKNKEIIYDYFAIDNEGVLYYVSYINSQKTKCNQDDFIIMHSTNRRDQEGIEIYERDILRNSSGLEYVVMNGEHDLFHSGDINGATNQGFVAVQLKDGVIDYDDIYLLSAVEFLATVVGTYISSEEKYLLPYTYDDGSWYCPECGEEIGSFFMINAPENDIREEWNHCECCEALFDFARWEMIIDKLNGDEDDDYL